MAKGRHQVRGTTDVLALQMDALFKAAPASVLSIFGGLIALAAYWAPQTQSGLLVWFTIVCVPALAHIASAVLRHKGIPQGWGPVAWSHLVKAIYLTAGTAWGVGGAWMLTIGDDHQTLVICCLAMGAVTCTFPAIVYGAAYNLFQVPIFTLFAITLASGDIEYGQLLALASVLLCIALAIIARGMGSQLTLALRLSLENKQLAEELADHGAALERANRELIVETLTDPLTGLANRRQLMNFMRASAGRSSLLIVDIDHFKSYNDSFGHVDGDLCLVLVADALQTSIRPGRDLAARFGGEEFAIILGDLSQEQAVEVAELVRGNVQSLLTLHARKIRRMVTVSIGFAHRDDDRQKPNATLMSEADAALYEAKNSGRNRVCIGSDPVTVFGEESSRNATARG
ncbi:diguanylate cyclase [Pararhizobium sp. DWP1-1-3]|uniref:GGDEF domain-containing protein n=1 Tax=Pararhizobium sp. DWP1-1-3 TaxID=2804652 RepID=UPI003CEACC0C